MTDVRLLDDLSDRVRSRYYGKYRGSVVDVDAATMRIRALVPALLGETPSGWCTPCVPYAGPDAGFLMLPSVGAGVWIEFEGGDPSYPIWTGGYWRAGEIPSGVADQVRIIVTKAGKLTFDDDAPSITIEDSNGHTVVLDSSGVTITAGAGKVAVQQATVSVNDGALEVQ